jgi:hypothetical protein
VLAGRCRALRADLATVGAHARFGWWPDEPAGQETGVITRIPYQSSQKASRSASSRS